MDGTNGKLEQGTLETLAIDLSENDIADVFATCVFCLNHAVGRALSATEALELSVIRLRLTRWGEAVNIYDKPVLSGYAPSSNDLCEVRQALVDILTLFEPRNSTANVIGERRDSGDKETQLLQRALGEIASARHPKGSDLLGSRCLGVTRWHKVHAERASRSIQRLEELFGSGKLRRLCARELWQIKNKGVIERLMTAASGLDPWMANNIINPHQSFSSRAAGASEYINIGAGVQYANLNFWQPGDAPSQRRR